MPPRDSGQAALHVTTSVWATSSGQVHGCRHRLCSPRVLCRVPTQLAGSSRDCSLLFFSLFFLALCREGTAYF